MSNVRESKPVADKPPEGGADKGQEVSLGCGTLILIALIVQIFGGGGTRDLEREVRELHTEIGALKQAVEAQTDQIKTLQDELETGKE